MLSVLSQGFEPYLQILSGFGIRWISFIWLFRIFIRNFRNVIGISLVCLCHDGKAAFFTD